MFIPVRRAENDADHRCLTRFLSSCSFTSTDHSLSMSMSSVSPEPDDVADSSPGWYLKDGPHRYVGVILVVVMVTIVIGIYLHVGRRPRQLAQALRQRLRRTGEKETASIPAINIISTDNEKRVYEHSHPSTISTSKPSASERPRSYQIAPEQVWMPEKPAPCVKQSMRMTVDRTGNPTLHSDTSTRLEGIIGKSHTSSSRVGSSVRPYP
ncbi:hypothetical protein CC2G_001088 [Coprinopsis cinerea AmutBmut pab1-1]|nr:hypothetical protein CC2G_001088 [Coprinopsis cinerea AmutBmut pab1-1]